MGRWIPPAFDGHKENFSTFSRNLKIKTWCRWKGFNSTTFKRERANKETFRGGNVAFLIFHYDCFPSTLLLFVWKFPRPNKGDVTLKRGLVKLAIARYYGDCYWFTTSSLEESIIKIVSAFLRKLQNDIGKSEHFHVHRRQHFSFTLVTRWQFCRCGAIKNT